MTTRMSVFGNPLLLGFDELEATLDRVAKMASDGYPPYNIEQIGEDRLRIVLAVAGFAPEHLAIEREGDQLTVAGRHPPEDSERQFLHRGIASRQFQRSFLLADGLQVDGASLDNGLLSIDLTRPPREDVVQTIKIDTTG